MRPSPDQDHKDLEARTREAHSTYIEALQVWENLQNRASRSDLAGAPLHESPMDCEEAEARKEQRRIAFRDLCDALGYIPADLKSGLDPEPITDRSHICHPSVAAEPAEPIE